MISAIRPALMALCCGLLLGSLYYLLSPRIETSRKQFETAQLASVHGLENVVLEELQSEHYLILDDGQNPVGQVSGAVTLAGYNGRISAWIATDRLGRILGVRIRTHRETPGLGDKIDRHISNWIDLFSGKSLTDPVTRWQLRRDDGEVDQITGATVTSRAVINMVRESLKASQQEQPR